ncbi:MAG: 1-acyl-sn-glycerol-3-phosphate acyltransferase [Hydrococcus sp. SU_1_0]|nr:1-acyl-sn-glycerol-3-phosphate acyltransferase [Hydrococcus sp. SU_1_0]NJO98742.1 1-acyl-sn-glycerol-3-phosphate acyltransferase [Pleurocapsa sp. CRU_1_2]
MKLAIHNYLFHLIRLLLKLIIKPYLLLCGFRIEGKNKLPQKRCPLIIICNHAALVDTVYLIAAIKPKITICGAKNRFFSNIWLRLLMRIANIIRAEPCENFFEECIKLLDADEILLIYPEMGRNPIGLGRFETTVAEIALSRHITAIPCYLSGTYLADSHFVRLIVGDGIRPAGDPESLTKTYRNAIVQLEVISKTYLNRVL